MGQASEQMNQEIEEQKGIQNSWTDGQTEKSTLLMDRQTREN
jgi:hypothetical protein